MTSAKLLTVSSMPHELNEYPTALAESRADVRNADKVRIMRLTDYNADVLQLLVQSPTLADDVQLVWDAGCDPLPADGGLFLVPTTQELLKEANDVEFTKYHVLLKDSQIQRVQEALKQIPRSMVRPKLKFEKKGGQQHLDTQADAASPSQELLEFGADVQARLREAGIVLEHTFLRQRSSAESASVAAAHTV